MSSVPVIEGFFTRASADGKPHLLGGHCPTCGAFFFPKQYSFCRNPDVPAAPSSTTSSCRTRGTLWSFTDNRYAPPPPYPALEPFEPYGVAAVELAEEQMIVLGQSPRGTDIGALHAGQEMELVVEPLLRDRRRGAHRVEVEGRLMSERADPVVDPRVRACTRGASGAATSSSTASVAARDALADAGLEWSDVQYLAAGNTMRNGYPGYVSGSTFAQALGWQRRPGVEQLRARARRARSRSRPARARILSGLADVALVVGADTAPKGFFGPLPGERPEDPDWLRFHVLGATNPTYFGLYARRRMELYGAIAEGLRDGQGEEQPPRARQPERAVPQGVHVRRDRRVAGGRRPAAARRHLRDERRRGRGRARERGVRGARATTAEPPRARSPRSRRSRRRTRTRTSTCPTSRPTPPSARRCPSGRSATRSRTPRTRRPGSAPTTCRAPRSTTSRPRSSSTGTRTSGCARRARPRRCCTPGATTLGGRIPVNPSGGLACFGEAIPAQAIAQVCELTWQLRGEAGERQVEGAQRRPVDQPGPVRPRLLRDRHPLSAALRLSSGRRTRREFRRTSVDGVVGRADPTTERDERVAFAGRAGGRDGRRGSPCAGTASNASRSANDSGSRIRPRAGASVKPAVAEAGPRVSSGVAKFHGPVHAVADRLARMACDAGDVAGPAALRRRAVAPGRMTSNRLSEERVVVGDPVERRAREHGVDRLADRERLLQVGLDTPDADPALRWRGSRAPRPASRVTRRRR